MMKQLLTSIIFIISIVSIHAQTLEDAVRYSFLNHQSTARSLGTGGGLGPVGVDFGAYGSNPAGLGRLRYSEAAVSLGANFSSVNAQYQGGNLSNSQSNFKPMVNNFGLAFANPGNGGRWKSKNFAISVNRLADFNREVNLTDSTPGSITDRFIDISNGGFPADLDAFEGGLAFDLGVIDTLGGATNYASSLAGLSAVDKSISHKSTGSLNELQFSYAANYNNKLLVGAGIGLSFLDYTLERTHREVDVRGDIPLFDELTFTDRLNSLGAGANFKAGIVYMPTRTIFVSIAAHTPTWYLLTDTYETELQYSFDQESEVPQRVPLSLCPDRSCGGETEQNEFEYKYRSPLRLTAGLGMIVGNKGFISGEVEFLDYRKNRFDLTRTDPNSANSAGTDRTNDDIAAVLTTAVNIKIGGEYTMNAFRIRGGLGVSSSPYGDGDEGMTSISFGLGYRVNKLFIDLGLQGTFRDELYFPYFTFEDPQPRIDNKNTDLAAVLTIGTKF